MARASAITVHVHTRVSASSLPVTDAAWHTATWRCRLASRVYAVGWWFSRMADRFAPASDHPR